MLTDPDGARRAWQNAAFDMAALSNRQSGMIHQIADQRDALLRRVAELELALSLEIAHSRGLVAQVDAYMKQHPDSPLLRNSGKSFVSSGRPKTVGRLIYEQEFDRIAKDRRISNPEKHRNN